MTAVAAPTREKMFIGGDWVESADGRTFSRYDSSLPGNGNGGHVYGTALSDADKAALVEYMKGF